MYLLRNRFTSGLLDCSRRRLHESQFSRSIGTLAIGAQGSQAPCYFAVHCQMRLASQNSELERCARSAPSQLIWKARRVMGLMSSLMKALE